jgi:hypothetical protein
MVTVWDDFSARIDWMQLVRGASTGFTVLVLGGLAAPIMSRVPVVGAPWLIITAVVAFMVAGYRVGDATGPMTQGASTAVVAYVLVLPLVALASHSLDPRQVGLTLVTAVVAGAVSGRVAGRRRDHAAR